MKDLDREALFPEVFQHPFVYPGFYEPLTNYPPKDT